MDMLSSLPDDVICHILSFLTTKEAALTSVLSKRWRNLFVLVPNLDIDEDVFELPKVGKREREGVLQSFMEFVDRVLALQGDNPIKKFTLKCQTGVDTDRVDSWIRNVLGRGVSDLYLYTDFNHVYWLPQEVCVSKTLVDLKVESGYDVHMWPQDIYLPMLKTLVLESSGFHRLQTLLLACPALEKLDFTDMYWVDSSVTLSSPILKELTIDLQIRPNVEPRKNISFDTPSLVYFYYCDHLAEDYPEVNLKNLVKAHVALLLTQSQIEQVRALNNDEVQGDVFPGLGNARKLFAGISNVQKLYLSPDTLELLSRCCEAMPVFKNLKVLDISCDMNRGWQAMPVLLKNCPNLETLIIEGLLHFVTDKCGDVCDCVSQDCISQELKGRSLKSCPVKTLEIFEFTGTIREFEMIRHFLEYFPCLKEMAIYAQENSPLHLKEPEMVKLCWKMLDLYDRISSCTVNLVVPPPVEGKWTAQ